MCKIPAPLLASTPPHSATGPSSHRNPSPKQELSPYQAEHAVKVTPTPLEYLSYVFGLGNLLSGPYLEYIDYHAFMQLKGVCRVHGEALRER